MRNIIIEPIISEKSVNLTSSAKYVFKVDKKATKNEIKKAIWAIFKVRPEKVNIINTKPKIKRRGRIIGKSVSYKKAIVTLKPGEKIKELEVKG